MNGNPIARRTGSGRNLLALLASSAVFMAGCSNLATTAPTVTPQSTGGSISGSVHGGSQPVAFSTVTLYYAGQNGVGSGDFSAGPSIGAPIVAAVTTSADDGNGSFSFQKNPVNDQPSSGNQFSCPTAGDPLVYVVARGGNTLNTHDPAVNNSAAAFIAMYGLCSQISAGNVVVMNEATTVATMIALQQYFNPTTESVGADGIGAHKFALSRAIETIANLADMSHGNAIASKVITGNVSGVSVTATPETGKINALANIIASCVNNLAASASPCNTLFANATPPDVNLTDRPYHSSPFSAPTDVLQALYFMLSNPTNGSTTNLQNLYNLIPTVGAAFQPTLTSAPTDWTVAINYKSSDTCGASSGNFISQAQDINLDVQGNLWIGNGQDTTGNLSSMSLSGAPLSCVFLGGGNSHGVTVDAMGNIWYASHSTNSLYRYKPTDQSVISFTTAAPPLAIFADGGVAGDKNSSIFFTTDADTSVYMIPQGATATTASTPVQISSIVGPNPSHLMVDSNAAIWVTSGTSFISRIAAGTAGDANYLNGYTTVQFPVPTDSYGLTVNSLANGVYVTSTGANSGITLLSGSGNSFSVTSGWPTSAGLAGLNNPTAIALDGRNNVWTANNAANSVSGLDSVSAVSYLGNAMMPNGTSAGGRQFSSDFLSGGRATVIDLSGNVWVAGDGTPNSITEIVGAAVPIYQPYSVGLSNGRFQRLP
jgi:streptogramin lyase